MWNCSHHFLDSVIQPALSISQIGREIGFIDMGFKILGKDVKI